MEFDFFSCVVFPAMFGLMAVFTLGTGLRGIIGKRPFLISSRWFSALLALPLIPILLQFLLLRSRDVGELGFSRVLDWLFPLMCLCVLVSSWLQMKGYLAIAVTDASFREGLLAALKKLELPYEECLSAVRLSSLDADLQVSV
jgi:hypothetical protein